MLGNAFIFFNRYLDVYDYIEDNNNELQEDKEFKVYNDLINLGYGYSQ